ncbi:MAG: hypothetical protein PVG20_09610 [Thioalkalispiraceae bacterium]|jgi:hypothetical protein
MKSRLDNIPVYETRTDRIRAQDYNLAKIALKRISSSIRLEMPNLRTLDFIIEDDLWVIVDRSLNDLPVIAWLEFKDHERTTLHEDISCERRSYHTHALIIIDKALEALQLMLGEMLEGVNNDESSSVLKFKTAE